MDTFEAIVVLLAALLGALVGGLTTALVTMKSLAITRDDARTLLEQQYAKDRVVRFEEQVAAGQRQVLETSHQAAFELYLLVARARRRLSDIDEDRETKTQLMPRAVAAVQAIAEPALERSVLLRPNDLRAGVEEVARATCEEWPRSLRRVQSAVTRSNEDGSTSVEVTHPDFAPLPTIRYELAGLEASLLSHYRGLEGDDYDDEGVSPNR